MSHIQALQGPHTPLSQPHILPPGFTHPPFPPFHPTHPPSMSPRTIPPMAHTSLWDNPCSGHPPGGRLGSSRSTGLLKSFPCPPRTHQSRDTLAPKGSVTSHTPQGHRDTRRRDPRPPSFAPPPKDTHHPSPPPPLFANKAPSPGQLREVVAIRPPPQVPSWSPGLGRVVLRLSRALAPAMAG